MSYFFMSEFNNISINIYKLIGISVDTQILSWKVIYLIKLLFSLDQLISRYKEWKKQCNIKIISLMIKLNIERYNKLIIVLLMSSYKDKN